MSVPELTVLDEMDRDDPARRVGVVVSALDRTVGVSNTTEHDVRILLGGEERVLCPSPQRAECVVVGILLWRVGEPTSTSAPSASPTSSSPSSSTRCAASCCCPTARRPCTEPHPPKRRRCPVSDETHRSHRLAALRDACALVCPAGVRRALHGAVAAVVPDRAAPHPWCGRRPRAHHHSIHPAEVNHEAVRHFNVEPTRP